MSDNADTVTLTTDELIQVFNWYVAACLAIGSPPEEGTKGRALAKRLARELGQAGADDPATLLAPR